MVYGMKYHMIFDWEESIDDRKSISGGAFFLGGRLVSWMSKKHDCIL